MFSRRYLYPLFGLVGMHVSLNYHFMQKVISSGLGSDEVEKAYRVGATPSKKNSRVEISDETLAASKVKVYKQTLEHGNKNKVQTTTCLDPNGHTPVILLSLGRSGTHSTWQVLGNLTGMETESHEWTGVKAEGSRRFFRQLGDNNHDWIVNHMCHKQRKYKDEEVFFVDPTNNSKDDGFTNDKKEGGSNKTQTKKKTGIVGFNWKPFFFEDEPSVTLGLKRLAEIAKSQSTSTASMIYIVRSRRNILDVYLSRLKHTKFTEMYDRALPPHCHTGSVQCIKLHARIMKKKLIVPNATETFYKELSDMYEQENNIDKMLLELEAPAVFVSYDKLYFPSSAKEGEEEWNKIFNFLGMDRFDFSWEEITTAMEHIPSTEHRYHNEKIANFEDVATALKDTELEHLLRVNSRGGDGDETKFFKP